MVSSVYRAVRKAVLRDAPAENWPDRMNLRDWMRKWHDSFSRLGVEVMVADVAQSCVVVDVAARRIILAPSLKLAAAEEILQKIYQWWRVQSDGAEGQRCSLLSC